MSKVVVISTTITDGELSGGLYNTPSIERVESPIDSETSRYKNNLAYTDVDDPDNIYLGTTPPLSVPKTSTDQYITVKIPTTWDVLSATYYGTPTHWWVLASANNSEDSLKSIPVGTVVRVPSITSLYSIGGVLA